ncbi:MAG TPA: hypothetical protein VGG61_10515 [Gemmataceae bacterium]|jgi:hypothetical protein
MRFRWLPSVALLCYLALPALAQTAPKAKDVDKATKADSPGLIVRIRSIDGVLGDFKYLAKVIGKEDKAEEIEKFVLSAAGKDGLSGFDTKRPIGLYGTVGPAVVDSTAVALIPIADEKAALGLLERLNFKAEKDDDDVYSVMPEGSRVPIYFRFANKYAYVTAQNKGSIDKDKLLDPATVFPAGDTSLLTILGHIDQIPKGLRQAFISQLELKIEEAKNEKKGADTPAQKELQTQVLEEARKLMTSLTNDGGPVEIRIDLDRKTEELSLEVSLAGAPKTELAESIKKLAEPKSVFGGLVGKNSAANGALHVILPESIRKAMEPVLDEVVKKSIEKETDKAKREQAEKALPVVMPSLKAGELDAAFDLRGPSEDKTYTAVAGIKVKDGAELDKLLRKTVADLPEADKKKLTLDADKAGSVAIHEVIITNELDAEGKAIFGEKAKAYLAIRSDAILVTLGGNALSTLKEAVASPVQAGKTFSFEMSMARVAPFMEKENPGATKAAEEAFGKNKDGDKVRITLEGGDKVKLRASMKAQVIKFIALVDEAKKK